MPLDLGFLSSLITPYTPVGTGSASAARGFEGFREGMGMLAQRKRDAGMMDHYRALEEQATAELEEKRRAAMAVEEMRRADIENEQRKAASAAFEKAIPFLRSGDPNYLDLVRPLLGLSGISADISGQTPQPVQSAPQEAPPMEEPADAQADIKDPLFDIIKSATDDILGVSSSRGHAGPMSAQQDVQPQEASADIKDAFGKTPVGTGVQEQPYGVELRYKAQPLSFLDLAALGGADQRKVQELMNAYVPNEREQDMPAATQFAKASMGALPLLGDPLEAVKFAQRPYEQRRQLESSERMKAIGSKAALAAATKGRMGGGVSPDWRDRAERAALKDPKFRSQLDRDTWRKMEILWRRNNMDTVRKAEHAMRNGLGSIQGAIKAGDVGSVIPQLRRMMAKLYDSGALSNQDVSDSLGLRDLEQKVKDSLLEWKSGGVSDETIRQLQTAMSVGLNQAASMSRGAYDVMKQFAESRPTEAEQQSAHDYIQGTFGSFDWYKKDRPRGYRPQAAKENQGQSGATSRAKELLKKAGQ